METGSLDRMDDPINNKIFRHLPADREEVEPLTVYIEVSLLCVCEATANSLEPDKH